MYDAQPPSHYEYTLDEREGTIGTKQTAYYYMDQVFDGWCSYQKASVLIDIILACKPKKIVEIGVWAGRSLVPMAYVLKQIGSGTIYGIDPWSPNASIQGLMHEKTKEFWTLADHEAIMHKLMGHLHQFGLEEHAQLIQSTSIDAPPIYDIDILHIDGNHSDVTSYIDVTKWVPLVRSGGWIIFDDINWQENGIRTNQRAVQYLNEHCHKIAEINDLCLWGIWVKP